MCLNIEKVRLVKKRIKKSFLTHHFSRLGNFWAYCYLQLVSSVLELFNQSISFCKFVILALDGVLFELQFGTLALNGVLFELQFVIFFLNDVPCFIQILLHFINHIFSGIVVQLGSFFGIHVHHLLRVLTELEDVFIHIPKYWKFPDEIINLLRIIRA